MKLKEKKEWAETLFTKDELTQKEIAIKVGVSEKTVSGWVNADNEAWKRKKRSILVTKEEQIRRIYEQIDELNSKIKKRPEGERYAVKGEADTLVKLTASAKNLETDASIADIIEVSKRLLNFVRTIDLDKAKELSNYIDSFIKEQLRR